MPGHGLRYVTGNQTHAKVQLEISLSPACSGQRMMKIDTRLEDRLRREMTGLGTRSSISMTLLKLGN